MDSLKLPPDLLDFLKTHKQLEYDPSECECGLITLKQLHELSLDEFQVDSEGRAFRADDPHYGRRGYYVVQAVDLVADCNGYAPEGILLWLPKLELFGTWDSDH